MRSADLGRFAPCRRPWHKEPWIELALAGSPDVIEQVIYFTLGGIVMALAALGFLPLIWRRALRLTRARLQLQVPLSMQEILAERDQLRAEFAVETMRAEQAIERIRASKTRDMATIGRQSLAATEMAGEIAALRKLERSQDGEIRHLLDDLGTATTEAGAIRVALHDAHALVERWRDRNDRDAEARMALRNESDEARTLAASLEARVAGLETRLSDARHAGEAREVALRGRLEAAMAHSARHEASGLSFRRELDEARLRIHALEEERAETGVDAREREKNATLLRSLQNGRARDADRAHAETLEGLKAENAALQKALQALRDAKAVRGGEDDAGLRAGIHALGPRRGADGAAAIGRERRRGRAGPATPRGRSGTARCAMTPADDTRSACRFAGFLGGQSWFQVKSKGCVNRSLIKP